MEITKSFFGTTSNGNDVHKFTLQNSAGVTVEIINFGGCIVSIKVPDKNGLVEDVVTGYDDIAGYEDNAHFFGGLIGRVANRICKGKFTLDGKDHQLAVNNGPNHLHGGPYGYHKRMWGASIEGSKLLLSLTDKDGEENYPGTLKVTVSYELTIDSQLVIQYKAETDQATPINLTNHSYFNLGGAASSNIYDHTITIDADFYTPKDETSIPTGDIKAVERTPFDFRKPTLLGNRIPLVTEGPAGFDHNFCLNGQGLRPVALLQHEPSGRLMEVLTDQPGIQFYSGNFLDGFKGKGGRSYVQHFALCLETQVYPDSINHSKDKFSNCVLRPGEVYKRTTVYKFSCQK